MVSNDPFPAGRASNGSSGDYEDDDSMASIKGEGEDKKYDMDFGSKQASNMRRSFQSITSNCSDVLNVVKNGAGMRTDKLCTTCKKIPFAECVPGNDEVTDRISPAKDALIFYMSLSSILTNSAFCKFCNILFQSICEPEYDLLKAPHIQNYLPDSDKYKNMRTFSDWIKKNTYWKREWVGGAGLWPFGYAVDRQQAASSTLQQAKTLFLEAEDRDINTKSLKMNDLEDTYKSGDAVAETIAAANASLTIINLATSQKSEKLQKGMASAHFTMRQLALLQSKNRKRLPCIFMLRAYRKDEQKRGALSVRVYGHGRAPLAPLKEICHFSLRFENTSRPRLEKQQIWYGQTIGPRINVPFFKHCVEACTSTHNCGELLSDSVNKPISTQELDQAAIFRLVDVHKMCIIEMNFSEMIGLRSGLRYVALSYRWGILPLLRGWKEYKNNQGLSYYHNEKTNKTTWTRPTSCIHLTSTNKVALSRAHSLEAEGVHIPKTIKHAIEVVQAIGERFMWVDQLCVPQQGDEQVMHANIQRMGHIYNRALFTIVAGDSLHADEGLRGLHDHQSRGKQLTEDGIIEEARMVLPMRMELKYEAWEERAWCFQEKLLSRRMLIFTGGFAVWHCRGGTWREDVNALDGDKSLISFPWLRLTPLPLPDHDISPEGLQIAQEDGSVRLMRLPSMHQYIEAVEDLGRRTIGKSCDILSAFEGLANILGGSGFLNSPFRNGLPSHFLDVALLWQSDEPMRRRQGDFNRKRPPSWTWAGWEAAQNPLESGSKGARVRYEQPFDVLVLNSGIVQRYRRCGEERIRPRKGIFYSVQERLNRFSLQELGLFGMLNMSTRGFRDWDSADARPAPKPRLDIPLHAFEEQHLIVHTELANLELGSDCWKVRTLTKRAGDEHCIINFHDTEPTETASKAEEEVDQPDLHINTVVSREHWINTATHPRVGTVKFDTGYSAKHPNYVTAILLSEAQYLGNETRPDVLGYPLYNIILVKTVRVRGKVKFMERIGLGKIYKYAWREAGASKEVVVLE
ncbi:heterokaryon incompatibility protein-domain-containing protein [Bipolaris maydis]|nr:heterokaryon incompatibility protein-domain-containing protein [Bipolaris maydis]